MEESIIAKKKPVNGEKLDLEIMKMVCSGNSDRMINSNFTSGIYSTDLYEKLLKGHNGVKPSRDTLNKHIRQLIKDKKILEIPMYKKIKWYAMESNRVKNGVK